MKRTLPLMIAAWALTLTVFTMNSNAVPADNTLRFSGTFGLQNPCNGEITNGTIDINIVVTTTQTGNGDVKVNVHHTSHGTLTGNLGNTYQISRQAKDRFDAIASSYVIPWTGEFIATGSAPDFTADGQLRVFVNAQNEPIGSTLVTPVIRTCRD
jgi:hypothetical protein